LTSSSYRSFLPILSRSFSSSLVRSVLLLVFGVSAVSGLSAQSSTSQPAAPAAEQPQASAPNQTGQSVQARIRARREARRTAAIHDVYSHLYEIYVGAGYERTHAGEGSIPGKGLQKLNEYMWNVGVTRYYNEKLGITIDGRGMFGTAYIGNNEFNQNHPAITQYSGMIGPTYRFILNPKYSVSGRVLAGAIYGNFSGDTDKFGTKALGLYPDGVSAGVSVSAPVEYNVAPNLGLRIAPEYLLTTYGSSVQNNLGFTGGVVVRWGKQ
jgi:hypothetical protein